MRSLALICLLGAAAAKPDSFQHRIEAEVAKPGSSCDGVKSEGKLPWKNGHIRWCKDPNVSDAALNSFKLAVNQYKKALPGCLVWEEIPEVNGFCQGWPEIPSVYLRSDNPGCSVNWLGVMPECTRKSKYRPPNQDQAVRHDVNMGVSCNGSVGLAVHEIGHFLGFDHEQKRADRDENVKVSLGSLADQGNRTQFEISKNAYMGGPYDYQSITHYGKTQFGKKGANGKAMTVLEPHNCEPNCPVIGQQVGLSQLDQLQLADFYQCKPSQISHWTEGRSCVNWLELKGRPLNCENYVRNGQCPSNPQPCCGCYKDGKWPYLNAVRDYHPTHSKPDSCKDEDAEFCPVAAKANLCWSGFVKSKCESTCQVCQGKMIGMFNDELENGRTQKTWPGGKQWTGQLSRQGLPQGDGVFTGGNGAKYVGGFVGGQLNGGYKFYPSGQKYVGGFKDFKKDGEGIETWAPRQAWVSNVEYVKYEGQYKNNKFDGKGALLWGKNSDTFPGGASYVGDFQDGQPQGNGQLTRGADTWTGQFKKGRRDGKGRPDGILTSFRASTGISRTGIFKQSYQLECTQDKITVEWPDGWKYVGGQKDCKNHGQGVETQPPGSWYSRFEGQWANGARNGPGKIFYTGGSSLAGIWLNGDFKPEQSLATKVDTLGVIYVADYKQGKMNGFAKVIGPDGVVMFTGQMKDDEYWSGTGKEILANQRTYTGTWVEGRYSGKGGLYTWPNGDRVEDADCDGKGKCFGRFFRNGKFAGDFIGRFGHH